MFAGLAFYCLPALQADEFNAVTPPALSNTELGSEAYKAGNYEQSIAFFLRAKSEADDRTERQNAYEQLIAAYLKAGRVNDARRELDEYEQKMPDIGIGRRTIYRADLLLLERKYVEAEKMLEEMMRGGAISGRLYFHLLSSLGYAQKMQSKWAAAEESYRMLQQTGSGSEWEYPGYSNRILCLIKQAKFTEAAQLLSEGARFKNEKDFYQLDTLRFYLLTEEKKFTEAREFYQQLRSRLPEGARPLLYNTQMAAAKYFMESKQPALAVDFLQDALRSAPSAPDRRVAMRNLINAYYEADNGRAAAETAREYLEFYPDAPDVIEVKMKISGLYAGLKEYEDAHKILNDMIKDNTLPMEKRLDAAKQAAAICESQRDFISAVKLLDFIRKNGLTVDQREEGSYLLGMSYLKSLNYTEALAVFSQSAAIESIWQGRCMLGIARTQIELKDYAAALETANRVIRQIAPGLDVEQAMYYRGHILKLMDRRTDAAKAFRVMADEFPQSVYAPDALYESGNLFYEQGNYADSIAVLSKLAEGYPEYKNLPSALYRLVYANFFAGKIDDAMKHVDRLKTKFANTDAASGALFWQVDYLRNAGKLDETAALLEEMSAIYKDNREVLGRIILDRAVVMEIQGKNAEALALLDDFYTRFVNDPRMGEALFLGGDIASMNGDYAKAALYYARCEQWRPDSELARAARGRVGDCNFSLYGKTGNMDQLRAAAEAFTNLLKDDKLNHDMYNQTLYKLAACKESLREEDKALEYFNELIFRYQLALKRGLKPDKIWAYKGGYAAVRLLQRRNTPEDTAAALKILELMQELKLEVIPEEFNSTIVNLKAKYKL